jgi:hypothetical protein
MLRTVKEFYTYTSSPFDLSTSRLLEAAAFIRIKEIIFDFGNHIESKPLVSFLAG